MSVFTGQYASNYDVFYVDKDYGAEATFVRDVVHRYSPDANSVTEFGCGSARHAIEFVRAGFQVTGIDRSAEMITLGEERRRTLPADLRGRLGLMQGDALNFRPTINSDVVLALFHVVSYQTTNEALQGIFESARLSLVRRGLFLFDFWYGPAVLTERPQVRIKRFSTGSHDLTRIAEPYQQTDRNVVDVKYTVISIDQRSGTVEQHTETHTVRYLFLPEIELLAAAAGFDIVEVGEWLTGKSLNEHSWSGYAVAQLSDE
jgi:SAM-dependent methyltransferase